MEPPPIRKTCRRYNVPGHARFLTFSCFHRRAFLSRDRSRGWMIDAIELARQKHAFDLWAWVIMPEHVHLLLFPRRWRYSISGILATMKQSVTQRAIRYVQCHAPNMASPNASQRRNPIRRETMAPEAMPPNAVHYAATCWLLSFAACSISDLMAVRALGSPGGFSRFLCGQLSEVLLPVLL